MRTLSLIPLLCLLAPPSFADIEARNDRKADTRAVIPRMKTAPTVDGVIEHDEWKDAMQYNGVLYQMTLNLFARNVEWHLAWTEDGLHVASHTVRMKGEDPRAETTDGDIDNLAKDDSFELRVYIDQKTSLRLVINTDGTWALQRRIDGKEAEGDAGVKAQASLTEDALDFEATIPFAALGRDKPGTRWRILPVRNFRTGTNIHAPMPYAHHGALGGRGRAPVFTLDDTLPFVQLEPAQQALYAGNPMVRARLCNPADTPSKVNVSLRILAGDKLRGKNERFLSLPPNDSLPITLNVPCDPPIDPDKEDEYRYILDITGPDDSELLHTHFTWNPTEHTDWLGDKLPGRSQSREREVVIDPREPVPLPYQRFMKHYDDLPEDHRLKITTRRKVVPGKGYVVDSVQHITPIDPEGRKNGVQTFYRLGYILEHSITWENDVRHGPEKFRSRAQNERGRSFSYIQKIVPWDNGVIRGVQRVFHPNGELLAETRYDDGKPTGTAKRYNKQGRLVRITPLENGLPHGTAKEYYPRRKKRAIPLREGEIKGTVLDYSWEGELIEKTSYEKDMDLGMIPLEAGEEPEGVARQFDNDANRAVWRDKNGQVVQTAEYRDDDVPDGQCILYWPRRIKRTIPYEKGLINGTVTDYWENGKVKRKRPFKNDILHGTEQHFDQKGENTSTRHWTDGETTPTPPPDE